MVVILKNDFEAFVKLHHLAVQRKICFPGLRPREPFHQGTVYGAKDLFIHYPDPGSPRTM